MDFEILGTLPNGLGRAGVIKTAHSEIKTPAFMTVGTHGAVRFVSANDLRDIGAQAMLSNGFHLRRQSPEIAEMGGLANWVPSTDGIGDNITPWGGPTLTDSGGFQVMSLGSGLGKVVAMDKADELKNRQMKHFVAEASEEETVKSAAMDPEHPVNQGRLATVTEDGVNFVDPFDGQPEFIGPEESMQIQCRIGADIHMAFDELTSLADDYDYNVEALGRTERWAERSLKEHIKHRDDLGYRQNLYGVLQGGRWEDLRRRTAQNLAKMQVDGVEFDGFGLGGAFLKEDLAEILRWCNEELPENKPRHLLGLSHPDDIIMGSAMGADTFDCVAPTREARHGKIYTRHGNVNLRKMAGVMEPLEQRCDCPTCQGGWTYDALRALWRSGDPEKKRQFYRLASLHNLRFIIRLTEEIRVAILNGTFKEYATDFLINYYGEDYAKKILEKIF